MLVYIRYGSTWLFFQHNIKTFFSTVIVVVFWLFAVNTHTHMRKRILIYIIIKIINNTIIFINYYYPIERWQRKKNRKIKRRKKTNMTSKTRAKHSVMATGIEALYNTKPVDRGRRRRWKSRVPTRWLICQRNKKRNVPSNLWCALRGDKEPVLYRTRGRTRSSYI